MVTPFGNEALVVTLPRGQSYPVWAAWGILEDLGALLRRAGMQGDPFVLSDQTVWGLYGPRTDKALNEAGYRVAGTFVIEEGEDAKSIENWRKILDRLVRLEDGTVRSLFLINLGGGVVGDLGGFAAATYRRGIPFVQVPTTLLAQVDSSVGGKTGVNHPLGKNLIGAFHQPSAVVADLATLSTLPDRQVRSGLVEVVKYGLIRDEEFFAFLESRLAAVLSLEREPLGHAVRRSCAIKAEIVGLDEREKQGIRTLLNLGHTFGHALEAATGYGRLAHGEAVAAGILCSAELSVSLGLLAEGERERIVNLLERMGLTSPLRGVDAERVLDAMKRDKKFIHRRNRFVLLEKVGKARVVEDVDPGLVEKSLRACLDSTGS
jgi:3-dehydroquinate synthase